jgi:hypothetical protein
MNRKSIFVTVFLALLAGLSLYLNRARFQSSAVHIGDRSIQPRDWMIKRFKDSRSNPVIFLLDRELRLTSVKVLLAAAVETNQYALPIWNLSSESNSIPVKDFIYGVNIPGMKPAVKGSTADPLEPGVKYRLRIEAGSLQAEHDFVPVPKSAR